MAEDPLSIRDDCKHIRLLSGSHNTYHHPCREPKLTQPNSRFYIQCGVKSGKDKPLQHFTNDWKRAYWPVWRHLLLILSPSLIYCSNWSHLSNCEEYFLLKTSIIRAHPSWIIWTAFLRISTSICSSPWPLIIPQSAECCFQCLSQGLLYLHCSLLSCSWLTT